MKRRLVNRSAGGLVLAAAFGRAAAAEAPRSHRISFHVGSGCYDPSVYTDAIRRARAAFDIGRDAGYEFHLLDVGGGFEDALFEQAAGVLTEAIDLYFPDRCNLRLISEPGRFYVSNAFRLAANIIAKRGKMAENLSDTVPDETDQPCVMCMFSWCYSASVRYL